MDDEKTGNSDDDGVMSDVDAALWNHFSAGIKPLKNRNVRPPEKTVRTKPQTDVHRKTPAREAPETAPPVKKARGKGIDGAMRRKLQSGKITPQGTLDLHGKTQDQAQKLIIDFIVASQRQGKKVVLIITGTGTRTAARGNEQDWHNRSSAPGILKQRFQEFVSHPRIDDIVLHTQSAHRSHGGAGAYYVCLRSMDKMPKP